MLVEAPSRPPPARCRRRTLRVVVVVQGAEWADTHHHQDLGGAAVATKVTWSTYGPVLRKTGNPPAAARVDADVTAGNVVGRYTGPTVPPANPLTGLTVPPGPPVIPVHITARPEGT